MNNENEFIKEREDSRDNVANKITYNETFFNNESNASSSLVNPLINNNNNNTDHITCFQKTLYDSLVRDENEENEQKLNTTNSTVSSSICRDGYVTNQRYQMLKDNKRSEMQRTHCYDEVFPAKQEESENSTDDDDEDDDDEEYNQANNDISASASSTETLSKSVVIQMNDDDDNDDDYMGKKKFESLIQRQELENSKKSHVQVSNKYDQEKNLLEKFKNECRLGNDKTTESVIKAKEVLIKLDMASTSDRYSSILNSR